MWVCTDVGGNRACGCWIIHTPCRTAGVTAHRAHVCMCQLGHADKDGHREEKKRFYMMKACSKFSILTEAVIKKKRERDKEQTYSTYILHL